MNSVNIKRHLNNEIFPNLYKIVGGVCCAVLNYHVATAVIEEVFPAITSYTRMSCTRIQIRISIASTLLLLRPCSVYRVTPIQSRCYVYAFACIGYAECCYTPIVQIRACKTVFSDPFRVQINGSLFCLLIIIIVKCDEFMFLNNEICIKKKL